MRRTGLLPCVEFSDIDARLMHGLSMAIGEEVKAHKPMTGCTCLQAGEPPKAVREASDNRSATFGKVSYSTRLCA